MWFFWAGWLIQTVSGRSRIFGLAVGAESVRVSGAGLRRGSCVAFGGFVGGQAVVHVGGCVQTDAGVAVLVVVPVDEGVHELPCVGQGSEAFGERRARTSTS